MSRLKKPPWQPSDAEVVAHDDQQGHGPEAVQRADGSLPRSPKAGQQGGRGGCRSSRLLHCPARKRSYAAVSLPTTTESMRGSLLGLNRKDGLMPVVGPGSYSDEQETLVSNEASSSSPRVAIRGRKSGVLRRTSRAMGRANARPRVAPASTNSPTWRGSATGPVKVKDRAVQPTVRRFESGRPHASATQADAPWPCAAAGSYPGSIMSIRSRPPPRQ